MQIGVFGMNSGATYGPGPSARLALRCEEPGYDSWWAGEHVVVPSPWATPSPMRPTDPILDPLVHLAFVATASERLLLGTGIIILPQRNPLVLAKQIASLDAVSGGRFVFGVGVGYLEPEMSAIGVPLSERASRTDDHLATMRAIWYDDGPVSFEGPHTSFAGVDAPPTPKRADPDRHRRPHARRVPASGRTGRRVVRLLPPAPKDDRDRRGRVTAQRPTGRCGRASWARWRSASPRPDR